MNNEIKKYIEYAKAFLKKQEEIDNFQCYFTPTDQKIYWIIINELEESAKEIMNLKNKIKALKKRLR